MASTKNYLNPQTLAQLEGLSLRARHVVDGYLSGAHRSAHHGYSAEFSQHRPYAPGDDLRKVDWKAFGRTDKLFVRQFVDETNLTCTFLLDGSASMRYQGADSAWSKFECAGCIVMALSWLLRKQGDAVGLGIFGEAFIEKLNPQATDDQINRFASLIEGCRLDTETSIESVLSLWSNSVAGRNLVVIVSDLFDELTDIKRSLLGLKQFGHEVIVIQVCDRDEMNFPFDERSRFFDVEHETESLLDAQVQRKIYLQNFNAFVNEIATTCRAQSVDFLQVVTDESLDQSISSFLVSRSRREIGSY